MDGQDANLRRALVAALKSEPSVAAACRKAGCARSLAYKLAARDERVREAMALAQAKPTKGRKRPALTPAEVPPGLRAKALAQLDTLLDDKTLSPRDRGMAIKLALDVTKPAAGAPVEPVAAPVDHEAERLRVIEGARAFLADHKKRKGS